jgi:hypothetical protein
MTIREFELVPGNAAEIVWRDATPGVETKLGAESGSGT